MAGNSCFDGNTSAVTLLVGLYDWALLQCPFTRSHAEIYYNYQLRHEQTDATVTCLLPATKWLIKIRGFIIYIYVQGLVCEEVCPKLFLFGFEAYLNPYYLFVWHFLVFKFL